MSLMFSLTMKTISGEYTSYRFEITSERRYSFQSFADCTFFNTKLLEDTTDKDENF